MGGKRLEKISKQKTALEKQVFAHKYTEVGKNKCFWTFQNTFRRNYNEQIYDESQTRDILELYLHYNITNFSSISSILPLL